MTKWPKLDVQLLNKTRNLLQNSDNKNNYHSYGIYRTNHLPAWSKQNPVRPY
jgi:hypothetical protein